MTKRDLGEYWRQWLQFQTNQHFEGVAFIRRRFLKTRFHDEAYLFLPTRRRLLSFRKCGWQREHLIRPADTLASYKNLPEIPNMHYLDRVVFNQRRGEFAKYDLKIPLWEEIQNSLLWIGSANGGPLEHGLVSAQKIRELGALCETRQFIFGEALKPTA